MTALLALSGALIIGISDFVGGYISRDESPYRVTFTVQLASLATIAVAVWIVAAPQITQKDLVVGGVGGLAIGVAFVALYASFAAGKISLVSPVAAVTGALVPIVYGLFQGESLSTLVVVGILMAFVGVALVTQESSDDPAAAEASRNWSAYWLAVLAGLGFGTFFTLLGETSPDAGLWPILVARLTSVPAVGLASLIITGGVLVQRSGRRISALAGVGEAAATVLALWAYQRGPLAVAAVFSSMYPLSTVFLARVALHEKLRTVQWIGVALALGAMPLVAVG